jgi:rhodanese-related sulfurtransferase
MPVPPIERDELRRKIESDDNLVLVDALSPMSYAHSHLPGAVNIPPGRVDELARRIPDKGGEIVVYCLDPECESSVEVAGRLVELGYTNVRHYAGGKNDWVAAGLPLERAGALLT